MNRMLRTSCLGLLFALLPVAAHAQSPLGNSLGFQPRVPVSAFAGATRWFDPSRLHLSSTVSVGSGWRGGSDALQVTRLSYQFARPAFLEVGVGNGFGGSTANGSGMFLESLRFGFKPSATSFIAIQFQNVRSPLQYRSADAGPWGW